LIAQTWSLPNRAYSLVRPVPAQPAPSVDLSEPGARSTSRSDSKTYRPGVDVSRLVASALVVCFHAPQSPFPQITISGLTFFVLLTFCLQAMGDHAGRPFPFKDRAHRLLVPWLVWSLAYCLPKLLKRQSILGEIYQNPNWLLIGSAIHLWFLPFAFLGSIAAFLLGRAIFRCSSTVGLIASVLIALVPVGVVSYYPQPLVVP